MPPPDLVIFGAGYDAAPVAQLAWTLGFAVTVVDVREKFLTKERFGSATRVCAHFSQFAERVTLGPGSFALIMNHHVERDQESLRFSLDSDAAYIGVLGPRSRYDKLLAGLAAQEYVPDPTRAACVRSPVGLSLGAETPEEVATSILGELLAIRRGFEGGFLSGSVRSLHSPGGETALGQLVVFGRVDIHQQVRPEIARPWSARRVAAEPSERRAGAGRARERTRARTDEAAPSPHRSGR